MAAVAAVGCTDRWEGRRRLEEARGWARKGLEEEEEVVVAVALGRGGEGWVGQGMGVGPGRRRRA